MTISKRKLEHTKICLEKKVEASNTGFNDINFQDIDFIHQALPEINLEDIDLTGEFLGKRLSAPLIISALTGGATEMERINKNLAKAAQSSGIALGVGSQRAAIEDSALERTYQVRDVAPDILLIANLGIVQFNKGYGIAEAKKVIDMIGADAIALHLNALQEVCQLEGDTDWKGCLGKIEQICSRLDKPVIVKETGAGITKEIAQQLEQIGVAAIDVSGSGGTSVSLVENYRKSAIGKTFKDWGIPTAISLIEVKSVVKVPVIASGGVRSGIDIAKSLALGADLVGIALPFLKPATISGKAVELKLQQLVKELKATMFLVAAKNLSQLRQKPIVISGKTKEWLEARGISVKEICQR